MEDTVKAIDDLLVNLKNEQNIYITDANQKIGLIIGSKGHKSKVLCIDFLLKLRELHNEQKICSNTPS